MAIRGEFAVRGKIEEGESRLEEILAVIAKYSTSGSTTDSAGFAIPIQNYCNFVILKIP